MTGHATIRNSCLYLPNGEKIPNDGSGHGLKNRIDNWLVDNRTSSSEVSASSSQLNATIVFQHDSLPYITTLSLEAVCREVHMAQVAEIPEPDNGDSLTGELYDMFEVFTAEKKKCDIRPPKLPEAAPPMALHQTPAPPVLNTAHAPQYKY